MAKHTTVSRKENWHMCLGIANIWQSIPYQCIYNSQRKHQTERQRREWNLRRWDSERGHLVSGLYKAVVTICISKLSRDSKCDNDRGRFQSGCYITRRQYEMVPRRDSVWMTTRQICSSGATSNIKQTCTVVHFMPSCARTSPVKAITEPPTAELVCDLTTKQQ